ncbi:unnamed protein product [Prorocentrum cordatum]|uniref:OTU domain-containing protein n=1 Tax=Prorocentrum cordatum TaxID=2364126 RepID=A0ABN9U653_9DINO|nr:unnamed protein product [Polarella glacialis]
MAAVLTTAGVELFLNGAAVLFAVRTFNKSLPTCPGVAMMHMNVFLSSIVSDMLSEQIAIHSCLSYAVFVDPRIFSIGQSRSAEVSFRNWVAASVVELFVDAACIWSVALMLPISFGGMVSWARKSPAMMVFSVCATVYPHLIGLHNFLDQDRYAFGDGSCAFRAVFQWEKDPQRETRYVMTSGLPWTKGDKDPETFQTATKFISLMLQACIINLVSFWIVSEKETEEHGIAFLRELAVAVLKGPAEDEQERAGRQAGVDGESWTTYVKRMSRSGQWADEEMLRALSKAIEHPIIVFVKNSNPGHEGFFTWVYGDHFPAPAIPLYWADEEMLRALSKAIEHPIIVFVKNSNPGHEGFFTWVYGDHFPAPAIPLYFNGRGHCDLGGAERAASAGRPTLEASLRRGRPREPAEPAAGRVGRAAQASRSGEGFQQHFHGAARWVSACPRPCGESMPCQPAESTHASESIGRRASVKGDTCYGQVAWAMQAGIAEKPGWYLPLSRNSAFGDLQESFHGVAMYSSMCYKPCRLRDSVEWRPAESTDTSDSIGCRKLGEGDACCRKMLWWAMQIGIVEKPGWYLPLTRNSTFEDFQEHCHPVAKYSSICPKPCRSPNSVERRPAESIDISEGIGCRIHVEGDACYRQATWAMHTGIVESPSWYLPLSRNSTFQDFQEHLHGLARYSSMCPKSCVAQKSANQRLARGQCDLYDAPWNATNGRDTNTTCASPVPEGGLGVTLNKVPTPAPTIAPTQTPDSCDVADRHSSSNDIPGRPSSSLRRSADELPGAAPAFDLRLHTAELSGLSKVVECCQPLLFEIVGFLAQSPKDVAFLCGMSARFVNIQIRPVANSIWKDLYAQARTD